jgi:hypothetical protein
MNNPDVYDTSDMGDWYRLGYKTAYDLMKYHGVRSVIGADPKDFMPLPFYQMPDTDKYDMWEKGWVDGFGDAEVHLAESCTCYPGMCPQGCEPACPVC